MEIESEGLLRRLDVIIALLLQGMSPRDDARTLKQQIAVLHNLGLRPSEISRILGRTQAHINKELVAIRREKNK